MDTKTAQKQLVSLITEHLSDSIPVTRILTYKPSSNGAVTGRFESSGRVYNFMFNGMDARYKPAMNADSALFSDYYLERFDAAVTPVVKGTRALPKCTSKSYSCKGNVGVRCLPLTQHCKIGNSAIGNERLNKIKDLSKSLASSGEDNASLETARAKIVEKRMALAVENRAKREPKNLVKPIEATKAVAPVKNAKAATPKKEKVVKPKKEVTEKVKPIKDYEDFKVKALTAFRDLNEDYDHSNLVPIHQLRDALGKSVSKEDFDKYLMKLQSSDAVQLVQRDAITATLSKEDLSKSLTNSFGDIKTDVKLLDKTALNNLPERKDQGKSTITQKDFDTNLDKLYSGKKNQQNNGLIPIHEIRSALGDKVSKKDFDKWTQENNGYQLITGGVADLTPEKIKGSIKTELGGMRYYIKKIEPVKKESSNAKIDLDLLDDLEPMPVQKKSAPSVNKDTLIKNWLKEFEAFEKGDRSKASVDSKEKDSEGKPIIRTFLGKDSYTVDGKKYPKVNVLGSIEVSKDLRGQGIFSELIKEIEKRHPDRPIVIESAGENAIALAKKNGFTEDTHAIANWVKLPKK